jgi:hypothetical protein
MQLLRIVVVPPEIAPRLSPPLRHHRIKFPAWGAAQGRTISALVSSICYAELQVAIINKPPNHQTASARRFGLILPAIQFLVPWPSPPPRVSSLKLYVNLFRSSLGDQKAAEILIKPQSWKEKCVILKAVEVHAQSDLAHVADAIHHPYVLPNSRRKRDEDPYTCGDEGDNREQFGNGKRLGAADAVVGMRGMHLYLSHLRDGRAFSPSRNQKL